MATNSYLPSLEILLAAFPEWKELARTEQHETGGEPYTVITVPAPPEADTEHGLIIEASNDEITVCFDCYHSHFNDYYSGENQSAIPKAIKFINRIISEQVAVASWWLNDNLRQACQFEPQCEQAEPLVKTYDRIRIRSWQGRYNVDAPITPNGSINSDWLTVR